MRNIHLFTFIIFLLSNTLNAQPIIQWQNTIGGNANDLLQFIQQTSDGGYAAGGYSYSAISGDKTEDTVGGFDYWVIKTDGSGTLQWQNTIGGNANDNLNSLQQTSDNGYIIGGYSESGISGDKTESNSGESDYWVIKLNSTGIIQWQNTIGGDSADVLYCVKQTTDDGYILGGSSNSSASGDKSENNLGSFDYWVVKLDSSGLILWQNTIGGSGNDMLQSVVQTSDGGYFVAGYSDSDSSGDKTENSLGLIDYWVLKLDSAGSIEWQNTIGGSDYDFLYSVQQTVDLGFILGGNSFSSISGDKTEDVIGFDDYWIIKIDSSGSIQWQNTIGGDMTDRLRSIHQTPDNGYITAGFSNSDISGDKTENSLGGYDYWVVRMDSAGIIQWQNTIGGSDWDELHSMQITDDMGYILGGYSRSNISGDKTENSQGSFDYWIVKLYIDSVTGISHALVPKNNQIMLYPNPSSDILNIYIGALTDKDNQLIISDLSGRKIVEQKIETNKISLSVSGLAKGVYYVYLLNKGRQFSGKFFKD
jgi:hypothetical protein